MFLLLYICADMNKHSARSRKGQSNFASSRPFAGMFTFALYIICNNGQLYL